MLSRWDKEREHDSVVILFLGFELGSGFQIHFLDFVETCTQLFDLITSLHFSWMPIVVTCTNEDFVSSKHVCVLLLVSLQH